MRRENVNLTDGPITKGIISFAIPLLLSNLLQQLYNSVDSMIVGRYAGAMDLAAVGSSGSVINLLIGFFLGIATGTGILYAMHFGAGNYRALKSLIDTSLILSVIVALGITVFGLVFMDEILSVMNTPADVLSASRDYLTVIFIGTIFNLLYNVGAGIIRAEGDSARPLIYLAIGGSVNLVADYILVKYYHMGALGAAWATIASQAITAVMALIRLGNLNPEYAFRLLKIRFDRSIVWDIIRISVPCGLQNTMYNISNFIVQININSFGALAIAGTTAYIKIDSFIWMPMSALGLAVSIFVGQNVGAGRYERIKKGMIISLIMCFLTAGLMSLAIFILYDRIVFLFTSDLAAIDFGRRMMIQLVPFAWLYSITEILAGSVRGSGQATPVTIILAVCICLFRIFWLSVVLPLYPYIEMVNIVYPISWTLCDIVMIWYYYRRSTLKKSMNALGVG